MIPRGPKHTGAGSPFKKRVKRKTKPEDQAANNEACSVAEVTAEDIDPLPQPEDDRLPEPLNFNEDLHLWLEYTRFYDITYRRKVLSRLRQLKALDVQRTMILSELQNTSGGLFGPLEPQDIGILAPLAPHSLSTTLSVSSETSPEFQALQKMSHTGSSAEFKTAVDSEVGRAVKDANLFLERIDGGEASTRPCDRAITTDTSDQIQYPIAPANQQVRSGPGKQEDVASTSAALQQPARSHIPIQLQDPDKYQDARFFLIKSFNTTNVEMSQKDGLWITKPDTGRMLEEAFHKSERVILMYSVNKSRHFQGYARMVTPPSPDIPRAKWMSCIRWDTCPPFRVEWLNTAQTEFWKVNKLRNPFFDNNKIFVGRDGQELPEDCGRTLMDIMDNPHKVPVKSPVPGQHAPQQKSRTWAPAKATSLGSKWRSDTSRSIAEDASVASEDCANWQPVRPLEANEAGDAEQQDEIVSVNLIDW